MSASKGAGDALGGAVERARRAGPEQAVVDEDEVGARFARAREVAALADTPSRWFATVVTPGNLKSVRPVVVVGGGVEQGVEVLDDQGDRGHSSQPLDLRSLR